MFGIKITCLISIWICASTCYKINDFEKHSRRVSSRQFPCRDPQPRMVYLKELVEEEEYNTTYKGMIKDIHPFGTILHRCQNSGCCDKYNERCEAADEDDVDLTFLVTKISHFFTITAKNHTSCVCQKISDNLIK